MWFAAHIRCPQMSGSTTRSFFLSFLGLQTHLFSYRNGRVSGRVVYG